MITKKDITARVAAISFQVPDAKLQPFIEEAIRYDVAPVLGDALFEAISALEETSATSDLKTFWKNYVQPFAIASTVARFFAIYGKNATQFGVREMVDDTSQGVSDRGRGEMVAYYQQIANEEKVRLLNFLNFQNWGIDGVSYYAAGRKSVKPSFGIRAI
jgi:hypothetical protein